MSIHRINLADLASRLTDKVKESRQAAIRGLQAGADKGRQVLRERTPVDTGELRDSWETRNTQDGVELLNDAPHAGIVERGARPHPVSDEGREKLAEWAIRRLNVPREEAERVAYLIARKMFERGQDPTYFIRDSMEDVVKEIHAEVEKELQLVAKVA